MPRADMALSLSVVICIGCGTEGPRSDQNTSAGRTSSARNQATVQENAGRKAVARQAVDRSPATRQDLDDFIGKSGMTATWHYGERTAGELAGTWISTDGNGYLLVFGANGQFLQSFTDNMATGQFAVSDEGRIMAFSKWDGTGPGSHFWFDGQAITGPRGPNPLVRWVRTKKTQ